MPRFSSSSRASAASSMISWKGLAWLPHHTDGFALADVVAEDGEFIVLRCKENNLEVKIKSSELKPANPEHLNGVPDNCQLMFLHEPSLLHNLKHRYLKDEIYTYTAYILIALNPYKPLSIYDDSLMEKYKGKSIGALPPHVFAVADRAYRLMKQEGRSQSVIISGESGAGKTETSKFVMRYLAYVGKASAKGELGQRVMESNPVLEAFGNAKTLRNNNSSRFGKFIKINFNKDGAVIGASIATYLLERSRLVHQDAGERNYHIFYQLCAGASDEEKAKLRLGNADDYQYLLQGSCTRIAGVDDAEEYRRVRSAMDQVGLSKKEQEDLLRVLAALLHLGNVTFQPGDTDNCVVANRKALEAAAALFCVDEAQLEKTLLYRTMEAKSRVREVFCIPLKPHEAVFARNALAKAVYQKLFDWLVFRINDSLLTVGTPFAFIGVLDIFGFEFFEKNSFEQFCINYANEKLQQYFNQQIFKQEQDLYLREGIKWVPVSFKDNSDTIEMIEKKPGGILSILDEHIRLPNSTDRAFTMKVHESFKGHSSLMEPRCSRLKAAAGNLSKEEGFVVKHFAGDVVYDSVNFLEKNNDTIHADLMNLLKSCEDSFLRDLFVDAPSPRIVGTPSKVAASFRFSSVGSKFASQLGELMKDINATSSHFIRCIKPNAQQRAGLYDGSGVLAQIVASGMHEALRLLQAGFPTRCPFDSLYDRYGQHMPKAISRLKPSSFCEALLMALEFSQKDFQIGLTRVFFRAGKLAFLDDITGNAAELAPEIAEKVRRWLIRKQLRRVIFTIIAGQKFNRRLYEHRLFRKLHLAVRVVVVANKTFIFRSRRVRRKRAARLLQTVWRMSVLRRAFLHHRKHATMLQAMWRAYTVYHVNKDKLAELKRARLEREREERNRKYAEVQEAARRKERELKERDMAEFRRRMEDKQKKEDAYRREERVRSEVHRTTESHIEETVRVEEPVGVLLTQQQFEELQTNIEKMVQRIAQLESSVATLQAEKADKQEVLTQLEQAAEQAAEQATSRCDQIDQRIDGIVCKVEQNAGASESLASELRGLDALLSARIEKHERRLEATHVAVAEASTRLDSQEARMSQLEETASGAAQTVRELTSSVADLDIRTSQSVADASANIVRLEETVAQLRTITEEQIAALGDVRTALEGHGTSLGDLRATASSHSEMLQAAATQRAVEELRDRMESVVEAGLRRDVDGVKGQLTVLQSALEDVRGQEIASSEALRRDVDAVRSDANVSARKLEGELEEALSRVAVAEGALATVQRDVEDRLSSSIENLRVLMGETETRQRDDTARLDGLVAALREELVADVDARLQEATQAVSAQVAEVATRAEAGTRRLTERVTVQGTALQAAEDAAASMRRELVTLRAETTKAAAAAHTQVEEAVSRTLQTVHEQITASVLGLQLQIQESDSSRKQLSEQLLATEAQCKELDVRIRDVAHERAEAEQALQSRLESYVKTRVDTAEAKAREGVEEVRGVAERGLAELHVLLDRLLAETREAVREAKEELGRLGGSSATAAAVRILEGRLAQVEADIAKSSALEQGVRGPAEDSVENAVNVRVREVAADAAALRAELAEVRALVDKLSAGNVPTSPLDGLLEQPSPHSALMSATQLKEMHDRQERESQRLKQMQAEMEATKSSMSKNDKLVKEHDLKIQGLERALKASSKQLTTDIKGFEELLRNLQLRQQERTISSSELTPRGRNSNYMSVGGAMEMEAMAHSPSRTFSVGNLRSPSPSFHEPDDVRVALDSRLGASSARTPAHMRRTTTAPLPVMSDTRSPTAAVITRSPTANHTDARVPSTPPLGSDVDGHINKVSLSVADLIQAVTRDGSGSLEAAWAAKALASVLQGVLSQQLKKSSRLSFFPINYHAWDIPDEFRKEFPHSPATARVILVNSVIESTGRKDKDKDIRDIKFTALVLAGLNTSNLHEVLVACWQDHHIVRKFYEDRANVSLPAFLDNLRLALVPLSQCTFQPPFDLAATSLS